MLKNKQLQKVLKPFTSFISWLNDGDKKESGGQLNRKKDSQKDNGSHTKYSLEPKNDSGINQKSFMQTEQSLQDTTNQKKLQSGLHDQNKKILSEEPSIKSSGDSESDFLLNVPLLNMQEITMNVDNLNGRVALKADLADFIKIDIGAQVDTGKIDFAIKGIEVQAVCKVNLKQVHSIFTRALETMEKNPELLQNILKREGETLETGAIDNFKAAAKQRESESKKTGALDSDNRADTIQGIKVQKRELWDSIKDVSKDINRTVNVSKNVSEMKRNNR